MNSEHGIDVTSDEKCMMAKGKNREEKTKTVNGFRDRVCIARSAGKYRDQVFPAKFQNQPSWLAVSRTTL